MTGEFYLRALREAAIRPDDTVLALCAGTLDRDALVALGVRYAVISNVDHHAGVTDYAPYDWRFADAASSWSRPATAC
jgi:hypothetical protein